MRSGIDRKRCRCRCVHSDNRSCIPRRQQCQRIGSRNALPGSCCAEVDPRNSGGSIVPLQSAAGRPHVPVGPPTRSWRTQHIHHRHIVTTIARIATCLAYIARHQFECYARILLHTAKAIGCSSRSPASQEQANGGQRYEQSKHQRNQQFDQREAAYRFARGMQCAHRRVTTLNCRCAVLSVVPKAVARLSSQRTATVHLTPFASH